MLKLNLEREYKAAIYLRLSKDDGDFSVSGEKLESDSISNQRLLIKNFLKKHPEIVSTKEFCDDGYTGTNFDRPHFQEMMTAISSGELDCIVVKDLSRFGREYIEVGKYIEKIFPRLGIRFIAINDSYDNALPNSAANEIVLPFKNLINDSYCRDISIKVRSNLDAKRRNGEFVGSRVIYGYLRSPEDKNKLVVDVNVASVVQDIFRWKTEGLSPAQIAEKLNSNGVLSPIEYKRSCGSKQRTCFQTKKQAVWSAVAIYRILKNEMYTGTLIQGKTTTPNYKVKKTILKDETDWVRTTEAHEAIITPAQFDLVQKLMRDDTRSPVGADGVHPFSGKVFCADCGSAMVRKVSRCGDHEYAYFICGGYKNDKSTCSSHSIREDLITETVLAVIQTQIAFALDMDKAMSRVKGLAWENREIEKIDAKIDFQNEVIENNRHLKVSLYEDYHNSFVTRDEYESYKREFDAKISEASETIMRLSSERNSVMGGLTEQQGWLSQFRQYENITELTRRVVVSLIDRVFVHEDKGIEVSLMHKDQFDAIAEFLDAQREQEAANKIIHLAREVV